MTGRTVGQHAGPHTHHRDIASTTIAPTTLTCIALLLAYGILAKNLRMRYDISLFCSTVLKVQSFRHVSAQRLSLAVKYNIRF